MLDNEPVSSVPENGYETQAEQLKIAITSFDFSDPDQLNQLRNALRQEFEDDVVWQLKKDKDFMNSFILFLNSSTITDEDVRGSLNNLAELLWIKKNGNVWESVTPVLSGQEVKLDENPSYLEIDGKKYLPYTWNLPEVNWTKFTLYEVNVSESGWNPVEYSWNGTDTECLMVMENYPDTPYKVKFDKDWNLCPIAENMASNVKVLLNNVPECAKYLQAKAPEGSIISWNARMQDYVITSRNGETLTVEPSTIDWKWISSDLRKSLFLEDQANLLRGSSEIANLAIDRGNPQLQIDGGKIYIKLKENQKRWTNGKWGDKWRDRYPIITNISWFTNDELDKFVKYYNSKGWKDDWDVKEENKNYKKINIGSWRVMTWGNVSYSPSNWASYVETSYSSNVWSSIYTPIDKDAVISELLLKQLDTWSAVWIKDKYLSMTSIDNEAIYMEQQSNQVYYYWSWWKLFCIWYEENNEWKKWEVKKTSGGYVYSECVNVCEMWAEKLKGKLISVLERDDLLEDGEKERLSIDVSDGKYVFKNDSKEFPINDRDDILTNVENFWELEEYNPSIEEKLKIVYLASKYVPLDAELSVDKDWGNIYKWDDKSDILVNKDDLEKFWLNNNDKKEAFIGYLTSVSESLEQTDNS